jgi:hypothetical protein
LQVLSEVDASGHASFRSEVISCFHWLLELSYREDKSNKKQFNKAAGVKKLSQIVGLKATANKAPFGGIVTMTKQFASELVIARESP